ncbi:hypothetical protein ABI59_13205 [Acidobacteria bacterium Mor1]|nr:hypothetical protein ABI59_13205 [Acidobacteria bacterium Mor1]
MAELRWTPFLHEIADRADGITLGRFQSVDLHVTRKPDRSPVTEVDQAVESMARKLCAERHPGLGVFGEEEGEAGDTGRRLIIDPLDSTRNFIRGIPIFATLLAIEEEGEVVAGLVSAPAMSRRWHAERGHGAWRGDRRLRVSGIADLADAQLFHGDSGSAGESGPPRSYYALGAGADRMRGFGDFFQHVLVAEGSGEAGLDPVVAPWDIAAVQVIVEEAGGKATALDGSRDIYAGNLLTSNGLLHEQALAAASGD